MASNPLVLTLDFGTQSMRAALIDKQGTIVYLARRVYEPVYFSNKKGYAEQHADFYWDNLIECLKEIVDKNKTILSNIVGMTVTTFRDSAVLLDKNGKPLTDDAESMIKARAANKTGKAGKTIRMKSIYEIKDIL